MQEGSSEWWLVYRLTGLTRYLHASNNNTVHPANKAPNADGPIRQAGTTMVGIKTGKEQLCSNRRGTGNKIQCGVFLVSLRKGSEQASGSLRGTMVLYK